MGSGTAHSSAASRDLGDPPSVSQDLERWLNETDEMLRELSHQTDPQKLVEIFRHRSANISGGEYLLSLSRRGLKPPWYRITRHADWPASFNPWENQDQLPLLQGGMLGDLVYGDRPQILNDVSIPPSDPGHEFLRRARSILCLPQYDGGVALNMVLRMSPEPHFFDPAKLPDTLVMTNLFGRATYGLVLAGKLEQANRALDHELKHVGAIQRDLLPRSLPSIDGVDIAVSYETATRAGGDYYDFFPLPQGRWGMMIADVSGHGAPAAVVMAILRTVLHNLCVECVSPSELLEQANANLGLGMGPFAGTFVTAFYAVYDPATRSLDYSCAGHNPPIVLDRQRRPRELDDAQGLPLAIQTDSQFQQSSTTLGPDDTLILYTDGIIEANNSDGAQFGRRRMLDAVCLEACSAHGIIDCVLTELRRFAGDAPLQDDQTLVVMRAT